ncbi:MAG TPA: molybdate ABC transporter permease subunit [Arenimonas sp.]|jgi:molybdate transport system permease protein|nr:molybdate ABC transporter permease subunit [Arenimonas sp.]
MFSQEEIAILWLSLRVAAVAVLGSLPLAVLAAWLLARGRFRGRWVLDVLVHLPLLLPPVLTGYLLLVLFGRQGPLGGWLDQAFGIGLSFHWSGAALAAAVMAFPLFVRSIRLSIEAIPREIDEAAAGLGARPWARFTRVILPLSRPGIAAGMALAFAKALGEFGATITFVSNIPGQTRTLSLAMHSFLQVPGAEPMIGRLAILSVLLAVGALLVSEWMVRRAAFRPPSE